MNKPQSINTIKMYIFEDYQTLLGHLSGSRDEPLSETRGGPHSIQTRYRTEHQEWGPSTFEGPSTSGFFQGNASSLDSIL